MVEKQGADTGIVSRAVSVVHRTVTDRLRTSAANYLFLVLFVSVFVIAALYADIFFTTRNMANLLRQVVANGLVSLGMLLVILTGGVDLTVGSFVALGGVIFTGFADTVGILPALILAVSAGAAFGIVNGVLVAHFRLQSFIVTLAMMGVVRGFVYVYTETPLVAMHPAFRVLGAGTVGPISYGVIITAIAYLLIWFFLNRMHIGRAMVAIGGNREAVRLAGINVTLTTILAYLLSGVFSALAGAVLVSRLGIAQPSLGFAYELDAIAAVVIGGGVLGGGGGSAVGTAAGALTLGIINNLMNLFGIESYYQQIVRGIVIILAVMARRKQT